MNITSGIVLFAVIWFMVLFVVLPLRMRTQGDSGNVVPGTPSSAPENPDLRRKVKVVTLVSVAIWLVAAGVIVSGVISVEDFDFFNRM
jgi:predicted secreted protein